MKSKRKWLAGILSVVMTMTFMPTYAFAGEAAEGGADADAVWTVKNADGKVVGNYNEMQDAVDAFKTTVKTDEEDNTSWGKIILNHDASGSGVLDGVKLLWSFWLTELNSKCFHLICHGLCHTFSSEPESQNFHP